jgi:hypothetical protein
MDAQQLHLDEFSTPLNIVDATPWQAEKFRDAWFIVSAKIEG